MQTYLINWQSYRDHDEMISIVLPVYGVLQKLGRVILLTLKKMKVLISGLQFNINTDDTQVVYDYTIKTTGGGNSSSSATVALPASPEQIGQALRDSIVATTYAIWSTTVTPSDILFTPPGMVPSGSYFSNPSLAINTSRQASALYDTLVNASVDVTASLSLVTGQEGKVELKYADDSAFTTNVKSVQPFSNGNTGTLTIGLALGQKVTAAISGIIPAGKYYRLVTTNVTGTPTFGTPAISEVQL